MRSRDRHLPDQSVTSSPSVVRRLSVCLLAAVAVISCQEVPIWPSAPVPLLRAIARADYPLVVEWAESGADLDRPQPLADAGPSAVGTWGERDAVRPLELAVSLRLQPIAMALVRGGATIGPTARPLLCLTVLQGAPAEVELLHAHGVPIALEAACDLDQSTVAALARRNGDAMASTVAMLGAESPR